MIKIAAWVLMAALSFMVGSTVGTAIGVENARHDIANSCRQVGHFAVKRTGFTCERMTK